MSLEVIPFRPAPARFGLWCDDASLKVEAQPTNRFLLSGVVEHDFPTGTTLHFRAGKALTEMPLALGSRAPDALRALRRAMPRGVFIGARTAEEQTELTFTETVIPAAPLPEVRVLTTDLVQRVRSLDANQIEFLGATGTRCFITVFVNSRRSTFAVDAGTSAADTARAVASRCPFGFRVEVEGAVVSFFHGSDPTKIAA